MTLVEALDVLHGHSRAAVCTLTPAECAELEAAMRVALDEERTRILKTLLAMSNGDQALVTWVMRCLGPSPSPTPQSGDTAP